MPDVADDLDERIDLVADIVGGLMEASPTLAPAPPIPAVKSDADLYAEFRKSLGGSD